VFVKFTPEVITLATS